VLNGKHDDEVNGLKDICISADDNFILFGAGENGRYLANLIGLHRIRCFVDNNLFNTTVLGIPVFRLNEVKELSEHFPIIVSSLLYWREMVGQLETEHIENYIVYGHPFIFPEYWLHKELQYMSYYDVLTNKKISKYHRVAIYGDNAFIFQLIDEINNQCKSEVVIGVIGERRRKSIQYLTLDEAIILADCIVINVHRNNSDIRYELLKRHVQCDIIDIFDIDDIITDFRHTNIEKYKNIHKGERCFLVGNGPSLRIEDLNKLHREGEVCFACNKISLLFEKTQWRPNYYAMSDGSAIILFKDELKKIDCVKFIADYYEHDEKYDAIEGEVEYLHYQFGGLINHPGFSLDPSRYTCEGGTAIYDICLQMAVYMGFSKIYLLGVDNTIKKGGSHYDDNYYSKDESDYINALPKSYIPDSDIDIYNQINRCFEVASSYSEIVGFELYNATRGGQLEVLKRVDFDSLF